MTKTLFMMKGLPGSGKSTVANKMVDDGEGTFKRVNRDALRAMVDNGRWSRGNEKQIVAARDALLDMWMTNKQYNVIVDDTNLAPSIEATLRIKAKAAGYEFYIVDMTSIPLKDCIERDLKRPASVGKDVIMRMYNEYLRPKPPVYPHDDLLPNCVICDLDGTLADMNGRNPFDASTCEDDLPYTKIIDLVKRYAVDHTIVYMSGRMKKHSAGTERWLDKHSAPAGILLMRASDDMRKDAIVKQEIFDASIRGHWNVSVVIDDRQQVVDMWRSNGLTVLQVAEGDF